ncbi:MAG TPA: PQQ-binding-like beta-propeller repeat protein [Vicinamibacterales bacterium]|nr:PQQ-binding-like beta-propeller repeat protein [Vicinamibacterales bacterium]
MTPRKPLRLWPGVAAAALLVLVGYVIPILNPRYAGYGMMGAAACALIVILWWLLFSRARWYERLGAIALIVGAAIVEERFVHPSIAGGAQGYLTYVLAIPTLSVALVGWAALSRRLGAGTRGAAALVAILLGCLPWMVLRTGGITAYGRSDFHWRWTPTPEERLLAQADEPKPLPPAVVAAEIAKPAAATTSEPATAPAATATANEPARPAPTARRAEWPGFRGPNRDGIVRGVRIATDWSATPPVQLWRRPVGPGWSSFAISGNLLYTQEQRGGDEVVSCYRVSTGEPVWRHRDATRFWESNGGAGPRGTPTLDNGRVYTLGATGIVNVLDAITGAVVWSRNAASDVHAKIPFWGISSSPLVVDDAVIVAAGGKLAAYDVATGKPRWSGPGRGSSYSSPQLATIDGVRQVLFISGPGTTSVAPATGAVLWEHAWPGGAIVQPALTPDGDILTNTISMNGGLGLRRLSVAHGSRGWKVDERWTSTGLKPYFNDFVVHKGHAYGFDGNILSCIDLQDGARKWKGGRYGNGQLVLLADEDLLLVLSEDGELALVKATPDQFTEVARVPALEGKTWNHPVVVRDLLLVRNDHEMAAFRLPLDVAR